MMKVLKYIWKLVVLMIFLAGTFSYAMFQGGFVSWFLFYSFLPFALYALALTLYPLKGFKVKRSFSNAELEDGEQITVKIKLRRKIPLFPLFYIVVEDIFDDSSTSLTIKGSEKMMIYPWFRRVIKLQYTIENLPRGEHTFHFINIKTSDPFGLIEKQTRIPVQDRILVYPFYENIFYNTHSRYYNQGSAPSLEKNQRDTTMVTGLREYQPGDRFSWIDWKATAKRNTMMTKEFEQRKSYDVLLVMDCIPTEKFETIVSFTASVIRGMLREGVQVGLLTSGKERGRFSISGGEVQERNLFRHLAKVKDNGIATLDKVLEEESGFLRQNDILMLVTSQNQLNDQLMERGSYQFSKKGTVPIFAIEDERYQGIKQPLASGKGVNIISVQKGHFADVFSEANKV